MSTRMSPIRYTEEGVTIAELMRMNADATGINTRFLFIMNGLIEQNQSLLNKIAELQLQMNPLEAKISMLENALNNTVSHIRLSENRLMILENSIVWMGSCISALQAQFKQV